MDLAGVSFYRELGFFARQRDLSDEELLAALEEWHEDECGCEPDERDDMHDHFDAFLLEFDQDRVLGLSAEHPSAWVEDDVDPLYSTTFADLARISRNAFHPSEVAEALLADDRLRVDFVVDSERGSLEVWTAGKGSDWLDPPALFDFVAPHFSAAGYALCAPDWSDEVWTLVALTEDERSKIASVRDVQFVPYDRSLLTSADDR
jgi:hypothetical protein